MLFAARHRMSRSIKRNLLAGQESFSSLTTVTCSYPDVMSQAVVTCVGEMRLVIDNLPPLSKGNVSVNCGD